MSIIALVELNKSACNDIVWSICSEHIHTNDEAQGVHAVLGEETAEVEEEPQNNGRET
jgi:hypothetical protein